MKFTRRQFLGSISVSGFSLNARPDLKAKPSDSVNIGFIGVGGMGTNLVRNALSFSDVQIPAICDIEKSHLKRAQQLVVESGRDKPEGYSAHEEIYEKMVEREDLDAVLIATPWIWHTPMAVAAMEAEKYCGVEVWGASSLEECWKLVNTSESTRMPCMILENHCYERWNMAILHMVRLGLFGELIHAQCGYEHDLRKTKFNPGVQFGEGAEREAVWRTRHSIHRNGDLYPTHGVGPVANAMNINCGNRFLTLTSTATKSRGLHEYIVKKAGKDHPHADINFSLGDIVTTVIKCANGETILISHDTNLPRPYSNHRRVQGTNGIWMQGGRPGPFSIIHLEDKSPSHEWEDFQSCQQKYEHPLWKQYLNDGVTGDHHGATYLKVRAFIDSVRSKSSPPIDVYDAAAWTAITPLSEQSVAQGGTVVDFPDFTRGKWLDKKPYFELSA